eukprot:gnl/TRDRNA2_/TRDRNA2_174966_c14_seq1.p1 gnl/TRDRNA2_/TRDRNA2_174966_c14~~gnl/TRDRNA2_/TRDRNA2_174966_c14_seq1.p1  ORF type:complete len:139 (+),score=16.63 gnl/TRDRNA2_/TRDRNA2_174966_c14_seq1:203-619(+)
MLLVASAELSLSECNVQIQGMMVWAVSRSASLGIAYRVFDYVSRLQDEFGANCFSALLMECEQRRLFEQELRLLQELGDRVCKYGIQTGFRAAVQRTASMRLAVHDANLLVALSGTGSSREASSDRFGCIWCACQCRG